MRSEDKVLVAMFVVLPLGMMAPAVIGEVLKAWGAR